MALSGVDVWKRLKHPAWLVVHSDYGDLYTALQAFVLNRGRGVNLGLFHVSNQQHINKMQDK